MFVYNVKINGKFWFRIIIIFMVFIVLGIFTLSVYKLIFSEKGVFYRCVF